MPLNLNREVFITCAVTGSGSTQDRSHYVPRSPKDIADSAINAATAGAARRAQPSLPAAAGPVRVRRHGRCLCIQEHRLHRRSSEPPGQRRWRGGRGAGRAGSGGKLCPTDDGGPGISGGTAACRRAASRRSASAGARRTSASRSAAPGGIAV